MNCGHVLSFFAETNVKHAALLQFYEQREIWYDPVLSYQDATAHRSEIMFLNQYNSSTCIHIPLRTRNIFQIRVSVLLRKKKYD